MAAAAVKVDPKSLPPDTEQLVGDHPVFQFSVASGSKIISKFGGNATVSVPYTSKTGEDTDAIVIYYINSEGQLEIVSTCQYDPKTKTVNFTTDHFSIYAVGYNKVRFGDVHTFVQYSEGDG